MKKKKKKKLKIHVGGIKLIENETRRKKMGKKIITLRGVLNIYGALAIIGLMLTIYTHPITGIGRNGFYFDKELMMSREKIQEFLTFLIFASIIYFSIVNVYFIKKKKKA